MTAHDYLLQLPDPDQAPGRALDGGVDTFVISAESTADALAMAQNYARPKLWAGVTPTLLAEAADMALWRLRVAIFKASDNSVIFDGTAENDSEVERVVLATGVLTSSSNYGTSDTVTIGSRTYSFVAVPTVDGDVKIALTEAASITNLAHAINNSGGTPGTDYVVTAADPDVTAVDAAHTLTVTARSTIAAATANAIPTSASMTTGNGAWGGATLSGGVDSENKMSTLAELLMPMLTAAGLHPSFNNSTHTLTVASIADNIGDAHMIAEVYPPIASPQSPVGINTSKGVPVPGFVGTVTSGGVAAAALTVVLAADTYGVPSIAVQARVQE